MADYNVTFRWKDGNTRRTWVQESARDSMGWVESLGVFRTSSGPVYVVVSQGRWSRGGDYSIDLVAYRIKKGAEALERVERFFPAITGASVDGWCIQWEHRRIRGPGVFPRPFEVRIDEANQCMRVWVLPEAALGYNYAGVPSPRDTANGRVITLALKGDRLVCPDFGEADRQAILRAMGFHRGDTPDPNAEEH